MGVRTLVVWCPDWPVTAAGFPPEEPVVVVDGQVVSGCSAAARASGVAAGLRRREAQARCPEATVVPADPAAEARAFEPVAAAVEAFVPGLELVRPGVCAFPTRGPSRYFGGDVALAARVAEAVDGVVGRPPCRVGVADGLFAAVLAARRARLVEPGGTPGFLAPFPVSVLAAAAGTHHRPEDRDDLARLVDLLRRLGLRTLGDVAGLPPADVLARFGPLGALARRLAAGLDERPVDARVPPPDLTVTVALDPPVARVDAAAFAAKAMADELWARLDGRGLACSRVRVEAETEHGETLSRLWRHEGSLTAAAMAERVRWQLDGWLAARAGCGCPPHEGCPGGDACPAPAGGTSGALALLRLAPDEVHPDRGRQQGFWGAPAAGDRVARVLARLQGMLGPEAVLTGVAGGGRGPAERVRLVPWGDPREPTFDGGPPWPGSVPPPAPATVHHAPVPAEVVDGEGRPVGVSGRGVASAPPARLSVAGGPWAAVAAWAGPWPVEERWWDPRGRGRRARWQVATAAGDAYLLRLEGGRWAVEATYD